MQTTLHNTTKSANNTAQHNKKCKQHRTIQQRVSTTLHKATKNDTLNDCSMYLNVFTEVMVVGGQVLSNSLIFFIYVLFIYLFLKSQLTKLVLLVYYSPSFVESKHHPISKHFRVFS